jgi:dTDP-4-amino-4,6-dideoxygalactose transaminase
MKRFDEPILVTRPYLPDLETFKAGCEEIWRNRWLTNNGPMLKRFEGRLAESLGVPESNISLFVNGTLALELGFYALGLSGAEVVTTPFTFVATSHALKRIGATPVFADVDPETLCLSPDAAEKAITPRTKAIVPVHVYGHPCDVDGFAKLGEKYGVKIIYDAAHAFGTGLHAFGDMSMFSFHPTKLFHSCEGGLLTFRDTAFEGRLAELRNFAIKGELSCVDVGTNAKMNELQALMGLECLKAMDSILASRAEIHAVYREAFAGRSDVVFPDPAAFPAPRGFSPNYAYCPVLFRDFETRERICTALRERCNVFARRYFYPLLTDFAPYSYGRGTCPVAEDAARRVLTLPTYFGLSVDDARAIAGDILEML